MKSTMTEGKFLAAILGAVFLLIGIHMFHTQLSSLYNERDYLGYHMILEFFSIAIAMNIYLYGLRKFNKYGSSDMLLLSFTFFTVGMIDILHTLTFKGMPYFITTSSIAKATWFWVIARILEALLMLFLIALPIKKLKRHYLWIATLSGIVVTFIIAYVVFRFETRLPLLVIEGSGTTFLKNGLEYFVSLLQFLSIIIVLYQYFLEKSETKLYIVLAFVFLLLSELSFTVYQSVYDLNNFTGHLFKAIGYFFILQGFYFPWVEQKIDIVQDSLTQQPGFIIAIEQKHYEAVVRLCEGSLLMQMGIDADEIVGKHASVLYPILGESLQKYCEGSDPSSEGASFIFTYYDRTLFASIRSYPTAEDARRITGTVVELPAVTTSEAESSSENHRFTNQIHQV